MAKESMTGTEHQARYDALLASLAGASIIPAANTRQIALGNVVFAATRRLDVDRNGMPADVRISYERLRDTAKRRIAQCADELARQPPIFEVRR